MRQSSRIAKLRISTLGLIFISLMATSPARAVTLNDLGLTGFTYTDRSTSADPILKLLNRSTALEQVAIDLINSIFTRTPQPGDILPRISIDFVESASQMSLSMVGGGLPADNAGDNEGQFLIDGAFWSLNLDLRFRNPVAAFRDGVFVTGTGRHDVGPHADDGFSDQFVIGNLQFPESRVGGGVTRVAGQTTHPNTHTDKWKAVMSGSTTGTTLNNWTLAVDAAHVPVPPALPMLGSGILLLAAIRRCRRPSRRSNGRT